jgi:predicted  nucleic acid-binding Zn-ribbon protein
LAPGVAVQYPRAMNASIDALLELQVIDKQRLTLKTARLSKAGKLGEARKAAAAADEAAAAIQAEIEKKGALVRQYTADAARCDTTIAELRQKQMNAKTNKEYMAIINGIETARVEKNHREQSLKDLAAKTKELEEKLGKAREQAVALHARLAETDKEASGVEQATPEEQALQAQYDARKATVDPKFLEVYERLVAARHPRPLMRVDEKTRTTPVGAVISHNQLEQIRMGKLVLCSGTNSILYI